MSRADEISQQLLFSNCFECRIAHEHNIHSRPVDPAELGTQKLYSCGVCGKVFLAKYHLLTHKSRHSRQKLFPCDQCGQRYSSRSNLKAHKRIHNGDSKIFNCPYDVNCSKRFSHRSEVKQHKVMHFSKFLIQYTYIYVFFAMNFISYSY